MELKIVIKRRLTGRLSMRVCKNGVLSVSAPFGVPKSYILKFIEGHREWIDRAYAKTVQVQSSRQAFFNRLPCETKEQKEALARQLDSIVSPMVAHYSQIMGVSPSKITYKKVISKWGSCNTLTRELNFSLYLLLLPEHCIEHVVVHELAHLLVPNHGSEFHRVMDRYFPDWRQARVETNRILRNG